MTIDAFADRLAKVRDRFVSTLAAKIDNAGVALPDLTDSKPAAAGLVGEVYRCMHGLVGIGPTVGFPAAGAAAREAQNVLRAAYQDGRGLTAGEISLFTQRLSALREAASCELQSFNTVREPQ
jgi:chemotaxis protein histidine kinase CheA